MKMTLPEEFYVADNLSALGRNLLCRYRTYEEMWRKMQQLREMMADQFSRRIFPQSFLLRALAPRFAQAIAVIAVFERFFSSS